MCDRPGFCLGGRSRDGADDPQAEQKAQKIEQKGEQKADTLEKKADETRASVIRRPIMSGRRHDEHDSARGKMEKA